jgi:hypothetical protein
MGDINWDAPGAIGDFGLAVQMRHSFPEAELLLAEIEGGLLGTA